MKSSFLSVNRIAPYLMLALILATSAWLWRFWTNHEATLARAHFDEYCAQVRQDIAERINNFNMIIHGGVGVFLASEEISREEWRAYYEYHEAHTLHPGIQGISFLKVIGPAELARHVECIRTEGFPEYSVWPEGERALYTPVVFIEPFNALNRQALGYDAFSDPVRRIALERARDTNSVSMSGRVRLVYETDEDLQAGFVILAPVYAKGMPQTGVEERRAALTGYVGAVLRVKDFMRSIFAVVPRGVAFDVYDSATISPEDLVFTSSELYGGTGNGHQARFSSHTRLEIYGHTWSLTFRSTPQFEAEKAPYRPLIIPIAGLAVSILAFLLMRSQRNVAAKSAALAKALAEDLRERKWAWEAMQAHERFLGSILQTTIDGFWLVDNQQRITQVNEAYCAMSGYSREELLRMTINDFDAVEIPEETSARIKRISENGSELFETRHRRKDGTTYPLEISVTYLPEYGGQLICFCRDITERKRAEEALKTSEERFRIVAENLTDVIYDWDIKEKIDWHGNIDDITGYPPGGFPRTLKAWAAVLHPEDKERVMASLEGHLKGLASYAVEYRVKRRDGTWRWWSARGTAFRDEQGKPYRMIGSISDFTERKRIQDALRESEQANTLKAELLRQAPVIAAFHDRDNNIVWANQAYEEAIGTSLQDIIGKKCYAAWNVSEPCTGCPVPMAIATGQASEAELTPQNQKNWPKSLASWLTKAAPVRDKEGNIIGAIEVAVNITERKRAEASLHETNRALEAANARANEMAKQAELANRAKSIFLANMSHEIRTPLNSILGFTQLLGRDASLAPRHIGMLHTIARSGQHLLDLINDILDMARIEAGRLELSPADFCLHDLLDDLELMFRSRAQAKQLQLLMERDDGVPRYVNADEAKLRQVLINLMDNAVKFTKTGGVAVRVRADAAMGNSVGDASAIRLVVEVEDSGPGIAEIDLDHIFESFWQSAAGREAGGTGLGLTVSRRLVELMDGRLTVKSQVGKGSCFRFDALVKVAVEAPRKQAPAMRPVVGLKPGTGPFRLLVVDDQQDNRDLLAALLEPLGFEIREAVNGQEALDVFEAWSPHAVLMDMRMPALDGYEATRRIKATEKGRATPVIAVTASAFADAESEILATGVDGYVRKPFRPEEIFAVLEKCLGLQYVYAETAGQAPEMTSDQPLTREDLVAQPKALRQAMRQAVGDGDMAGLHALIAQIEETDAETARKLRNLADRYDYETLTQVLEK